MQLTSITLPNGDVQDTYTYTNGGTTRVFLNGVLQMTGEYPKAKNPWEPWFAWRPVKIHDERVWLKKIYRREIPKTYVNHDDWTQYEYGTIFDVIRGDE